MHSLSSIHDVCRDLIDKLNLSKNLQFYEHLQEVFSIFFFSSPEHNMPKGSF